MFMVREVEARQCGCANCTIQAKHVKACGPAGSDGGKLWLFLVPGEI